MPNKARKISDISLSQGNATQISHAVSDWIKAVNSENADTIAALYTDDAVLLATFNPKPLTTPPLRLEYFVNFKARKKLRAMIDDCYITELGNDAGAANGLYTFSFIDDSGTRQTVKARFSFIFARQPTGDWLIAAHHSSVVPG